MRVFFLFFLTCVFCNACSQPTPKQIQAGPPIAPDTSEKINGLTFVAPPEPFTENPMPAVKAVGASWIAVVPYAFTRPGTPSVHYRISGGQWWGERPEGVRESIRLAHTQGIKVMLKPQVYVPGSWTGLINFQNTADWEKWEAEYEAYILLMADIAKTEQADMFCIGTEFNNPIQKRPEYWKALIGKIRARYPGKLVYSSNWDDWSRVPFWDQLDYIGLSGYFPLVQAETPDMAALQHAWKPICEQLKTYSARYNKPVLFTEYGYLSVDSCSWRNWELERGIEQRRINEQAQANCIDALHATLQGESWWAGGFIWKWFPNMRGHEGYPERDYTPQGKAGEAVLRKWFIRE